MKAVILAGGIGTRLRPLTYTRPKVMLPIANKPILFYIIDSLSKQGFNEIILTTSYADEQISEYFGDGSDFNVKIIYSREEIPLGTAGGVRKARKYLDETFAVIQGDNITSIKFGNLMKYHRTKRAMVTIALKRVSKPWLFGIAELSPDGRVRRFVEKPKPDECFTNLVSTGLYVLEPSVLDYIPPQTSYDFAKDLFPKLLSGDEPLYGYETKAFWVDVGNIEGYMEASRWILSKISRKISDTAEVKGVVRGNVWVGDDVVIESNARIEGPSVIEKEVIIEEGARIAPNSVLERRVKIGTKSRVIGAFIYENTKIGERSLLQRCVVGENCTMGNCVRVGRLAMIGAYCQIDDEARIGPNSRIWPKLKIGRRELITGVRRGLE